MLKISSDEMENIIEVDSSDDEILRKTEGVESRRFQHISIAAEINMRIIEHVPERTRYQDTCGVNVWKEWAKWRNGLPSTGHEVYSKVHDNISHWRNLC